MAPKGVQTSGDIVPQEAGEKEVTKDETVVSDEDVKSQASELLSVGKRDLVCGEIPKAVESLEMACTVLSEKFGHGSDECGEALISYGKALLELGRIERTVLGNAMKGVPEVAEEETSADDQVGDPNKLNETEWDEISEQVNTAIEERTEELEKGKAGRGDEPAEAAIMNGDGSDVAMVDEEMEVEGTEGKKENVETDTSEKDERENKKQGGEKGGEKAKDEEKEKEGAEKIKEDKEKIEDEEKGKEDEEKGKEGEEKGKEGEEKEGMEKINKEKEKEGVEKEKEALEKEKEGVEKENNGEEKGTKDEVTGGEKEVEDRGKGAEVETKVEEEKVTDPAVDKEEVVDNKPLGNDNAPDVEMKVDDDKKDISAEDETKEKKDGEEKVEAGEAKKEEETKTEEKAGEETGETEEKGEGDDEEEEDEVDEEDAQEEEGGEDMEEDGNETTEGDDVETLQLCWENLEVARSIYEKRVARHVASAAGAATSSGGGDGSGGSDALKLAEIHHLLADVSMENGNYPEAVQDYVFALDLRRKQLQDGDRLIAETYYTLAEALENCGKYAQSIDAFKSSVKCLEKKKELLEAGGKDDDATKKELAELTSLIPEVQGKVEGVEEQLAQAGCSCPGEGAGTSQTPDLSAASSSDSSKPTSDITHLVRKKRTADEAGVSDGGEAAKKPAPVSDGGEAAKKPAVVDDAESAKKPTVVDDAESAKKSPVANGNSTKMEENGHTGKSPSQDSKVVAKSVEDMKKDMDTCDSTTPSDVAA